ncbi:Oidioi.mRNA.OKI2018_I69.chr2.g6294.t1.cds [Oikopleura dioica]|uniref:Oidioi.mRNA.OKI2018_I69.chr2.g6294.t1.cds n=1 Tax=Oikopleura dioica TaxID=34765 RepID=A0ABN7T2Z1_OIKDI|nr:Oidioi.mRNA.OKI2018_I69.chr2.g6294.t1.cds [Oikopleura dioica]
MSIVTLLLSTASTAIQPVTDLITTGALLTGVYRVVIIPSRGASRGGYNGQGYRCDNHHGSIGYNSNNGNGYNNHGNAHYTQNDYDSRTYGVNAAFEEAYVLIPFSEPEQITTQPEQFTQAEEREQLDYNLEMEASTLENSVQDLENERDLLKQMLKELDEEESSCTSNAGCSAQIPSESEPVIRPSTYSPSRSQIRALATPSTHRSDLDRRLAEIFGQPNEPQNDEEDSEETDSFLTTGNESPPPKHPDLHQDEYQAKLHLAKQEDKHVMHKGMLVPTKKTNLRVKILLHEQNILLQKSASLMSKNCFHRTREYRQIVSLTKKLHDRSSKYAYAAHVILSGSKESIKEFIQRERNAENDASSQNVSRGATGTSGAASTSGYNQARNSSTVHRSNKSHRQQPEPNVDNL